MWRDLVLGMFLICDLLLLNEFMNQLKVALYNRRHEIIMYNTAKRRKLVTFTKMLIAKDNGLDCWQPREIRGLA